MIEFFTDAYNLLADNYQFLLRGVGYTMLIALVGTVAGLLIGLATGVLRTCPLSKNGLTVYGNAAYSVYQKADSTNRTFTFYMFFEGAKTAGTAITLFDTMIIPAGWNNDDMAAVNGMKIHVAAYGAQAVGFEDCYEAMTSAFPTDFPFAGLE